MNPKHKIIASVVTGLTGAGGVATPLALNSLKSSASTDQVSMVNMETQTKPDITNRVDDLDIDEEDDDIDSTVVTEQDKCDAIQLVRKLRISQGRDQRVRLSRAQRKALMSSYLLVSSFDASQYGAGREGTRFFSHLVLEDLNSIKWDSDQLKLIGSPNTTDNNWGWPKWESNPFRHFYPENGEQTWREKMQKYSSTQSRDNIASEIEAEIEFDIANWLLKEIERIKQERHQFFQPGSDSSEDE